MERAYPAVKAPMSQMSAAFCAVALLLIVAFGYIVAEFAFGKLEADPGADIHGYAALSRRYTMLMQHYVYGFLDYVLYEIHFHFWLERITDYLGDPYYALQLIALISACTVLLYSMDGTIKKALIAAMILIHPRALDMLAGAQRMGISLTVFLIATKVEKLPIRYALFALAISFHTYAVVLVGSFILYEWLLKNPTKKGKVLSLIATIGIVFVTVVLREYVLSEIGDRRSGIDSDTTGVLYLTMWLLTGLAIHFLAPRLIFTPHGALFYMLLLSSAAAVALGLYAERYIAIAIVMLAASTLSPKGVPLAALVTVYGLNLALSYYYWL